MFQPGPERELVLYSQHQAQAQGPSLGQAGTGPLIGSFEAGSPLLPLAKV